MLMLVKNGFRWEMSVVVIKIRPNLEQLKLTLKRK